MTQRSFAAGWYLRQAVELSLYSGGRLRDNRREVLSIRPVQRYVSRKPLRAVQWHSDGLSFTLPAIAVQLPCES